MRAEPGSGDRAGHEAVSDPTAGRGPAAMPDHPMGHLLREDRLPHIWCAGCGLGTSLTAFIVALQESGIDLQKTVVVSGIGCAGRVAGYVHLDSFHTTHGRALPFATGLKLANPELDVIVFSGDGDLASIGGNHLIHAARRNLDLTVICSNNFIYGMTGGQGGPTTPTTAYSTTTPYGCFEHPFNLPYLAAASGAVYVSRWTALHVRRLKNSMVEALQKPGFCFVEIISACPTVYGRRNKLGDGLQMMRQFRERSEICHGLDPAAVGLDLGGKIIVGRFLDIERPTYHELMAQQLADVMPATATTAGQTDAVGAEGTTEAPGNGAHDAGDGSGEGTEPAEEEVVVGTSRQEPE